MMSRHRVLAKRARGRGESTNRGVDFVAVREVLAQERRYARRMNTESGMKGGLV